MNYQHPLCSLPCCLESLCLKFTNEPSFCEGGDLTEPIKRSASDWLGNSMPSVRARTSPGFFRDIGIGLLGFCLENFFPCTSAVLTPRRQSFSLQSLSYSGKSFLLHTMLRPERSGLRILWVYCNPLLFRCRFNFGNFGWSIYYRKLNLHPAQGWRMQLLVQNCLDPSRATEIFSILKRRIFALPKIVRNRSKSGLRYSQASRTDLFIP